MYFTHTQFRLCINRCLGSVEHVLLYSGAQNAIAAKNDQGRDPLPMTWRIRTRLRRIRQSDATIKTPIPSWIVLLGSSCNSLIGEANIQTNVLIRIAVAVGKACYGGVDWGEFRRLSNTSSYIPYVWDQRAGWVGSFGRLDGLSVHLRWTVHGLSTRLVDRPPS